MSAVEDRRRVLAAFGRRAGRLFKLAQRLQVSATKTYALKQDPFSHVHTLPLGFAMRLVRSARLSRISIHEPTTSYAPRRPAKRPRLSQTLPEVRGVLPASPRACGSVGRSVASRTGEKKVITAPSAPSVTARARSRPKPSQAQRQSGTHPQGSAPSPGERWIERFHGTRR